ncbi:chemotaxis protein MotB [Seohaeicola saemankumensis]|uniref:flagellar motor protein MotB n=1 Tax=Seohaeicola saemankumensis TaxID=481181 RepID=UPI001E427C4F|nr:flagellar motor protein MotB [Seohaeicola saemankumensis]MCD1625019.1 chemotaxis protein MotB [Seohaeicola saemankumensis]
MGTQPNAAPVIIKRKKVIEGGGHHGGAWKVAYADFVTAMMAFFMLMWLLNATTEKQRKGLADYFAPTVAISRVSGGSDGAFGGDSIFSEEVLPRMGTGATSLRPTESDKARGESADDGVRKDALEKINQALFDRAGLSAIQSAALAHVTTRLSDEGLVVELFDLPDAVLFNLRTDEPTPLLEELAFMVQQAFALVVNPLAIEGHVHSFPVVLRDRPVWGLSTARANRMRELLARQGFEEERIVRVVGHADRKLAEANPLATRNNRLELILLMIPE